jgi:hypothetical protein
VLLWVAVTILCKTTKDLSYGLALPDSRGCFIASRFTFLRGCEQSVRFQMLIDGACSTCALPVISSCMPLLLESYQASQPVYCLCRYVRTLCCCCSTAAAAGAPCGLRAGHQMLSGLQPSLADATPIGIAAGHRCVQCICCDTASRRTSSGAILRLCSVDAPTCLLTGTTGSIRHHRS